MKEELRTAGHFLRLDSALWAPVNALVDTAVWGNRKRIQTV